MLPKKDTGSIEPGRFDELFVQSERELRRLASALKRSDGSMTLNVTALVNEVYLKLRVTAPEVESELHLRRIAGRAMRHVLTDAARKRSTGKRGGDGNVLLITWDENVEQIAKNDRDLLALDAALSELAGLDARQAEVVESHFFGGLTWAEVAQTLGVSLTTVERDWRVVKAWLAESIKSHRN